MEENMKCLVEITVSLALISVIFVMNVSAQPRFDIPLTITDGVDTWTMRWGFFPGAHYCIDLQDSMNGRVEFEEGRGPPLGLRRVSFSQGVAPNTTSAEWEHQMISGLSRATRRLIRLESMFSRGARQHFQLLTPNTFDLEAA